jgi:putative ABC transport system permease protein
MVFRKFIGREVKRRPGRAMLTLLSVVIGVAAVVAVNVATDTTRQAYKEMFESVTGRAALEVVAEGGGTYSDEVLPLLAQTPGVKAAVPLVQQPSVLYFGQSRIRLLVMGIDPAADRAVRDYHVEEGAFFHDRQEGALMEVGLARSLGIATGDEVQLLTRQGVQQIRVVGLLAPQGASGFSQGGVIVLPLELAQDYFTAPGAINVTSLVLADDADEKAVQAAAAEKLPAGLAVRRPAVRTHLAKETLQDAEQGLNFAYALTLVMAVFIIFNTFLMNVGERRRQLAILRAVGTTRRQVISMLLGEGLLLGILGTVLGSILGLAGAFILANAMARTYSATLSSIVLTPTPFLLAAILGPGISLVGMLIPAWTAGRISPLEGMRPMVSEGRSRVPLSFTLAAVLIFITTGSVLAACVMGYLPIGFAIPAGVIFTAAFVLLIPAFLDPAANALAFVLFPVLRTEGRIACRQMLRRRARTTLTVGVLYIAVSSGIALGTAILNNVQDVRRWQEQMIVGDFFVRAMFPDMATGQAAEMPESLGREIADIPGVTGVDTLRFAPATAADQPVLVVLREFTDKHNTPLTLQDGDPVEVRRRLLEGEVVIGTVLAQRTGLGPGDEIPLKTRTGTKRLRIAATATEYMVGGLVLHIEREHGKQLLGVTGVDVFMVSADASSLAAVEPRLKTLCEQGGLMLHSFIDLRRRLDGLIGGIIGSLWGLLALGFVVSGFGIANTLTMNVLEQTRELAMLRVVAMTRRQIAKTILGQATLLGMIGLASGIIGGVIGAYITNRCSKPVLGHGIEFALSPALIGGSFVIALAIVLLAAWLPARRAARLNILIALQYE